MSSRRRHLLFFSLGAILAPIGDYCHVLSGTLSYPAGHYGIYFFGMPFWTPLLFGSAMLAIGWSQLQGDREPAPSRAAALTQVGACLALYCASGFISRAAGIAHLVLGAGALAQWVFLDRRARSFGLAAATAVGGTAFELALVHAGIFSYLPGSNGLWGVPTWLPWLYFSASVAVSAVGRRLRGVKWAAVVEAPRKSA